MVLIGGDSCRIESDVGGRLRGSTWATVFLSWRSATLSMYLDGILIGTAGCTFPALDGPVSASVTLGSLTTGKKLVSS